MTTSALTVDPSVSATTHKLFSLGRTMAIAGNTFRDLVRQKVFYFMVVFAFILIGISLALLGVSFRGQLQTVMDTSLGAMSLFTMLLSVLATAMLLPKDIEERTLYTILAKPVARFEYLLGKLVGVAMMLALATVLMSIVFAVVLYFWQDREMANIISLTPADRVDGEIAKMRANAFSPTLLAGIGIVWLRAMVCAALTLMVSCFATSWLFTIIVSLTAVLVGYLVPIARQVWQSDADANSMLTQWFLKTVTVFFPDMQPFDVVGDIAMGAKIPPGVFTNVMGLGAGYVAVYLLVGYLFFAWREL
jgi:ABC-type Na+ efflux pump permease subunit